MNSIKTLTIASRKSDLARLQAYQVGDALSKAYRSLNIHYHFRESLGDINQDDPLWKMPEKGVFTQDFRQGLLQGQWDMVVHSWKDLPVDQEQGTELVATLPRADMRDLFLLKKNHLSQVRKNKQLKVFSSSPRRIYNLTRFFKTYFPCSLEQVEFTSVRGNILTRLKKMIENNEVDGLIVAKAAIDRLLSVSRSEFLPGQKKLQEYLQQCLWQVLPLSENPTAAAQGALAVEVASENKDLKNLLQSIHCDLTWQSVNEERKILKSHGGGCHQKIGVSQIKRDYGTMTFLKGLTEQGEVLDSFDFSQDLPKLTKPFLEKQSWYERKALGYQFPQAGAHLIARSLALPLEQKLPQDHIIWVSGLKTWESLAKRGLWVHGSSESLGESELKLLKPLCGKLSWAKWTHSQSPKALSMENVATYELIPKTDLPDIKKYQEFFWMSGSQFERALNHEPELVTRDHFCGPGNTFAIICELLKARGIHKKPRILPSYEIWQQAVRNFHDSTL